MGGQTVTKTDTKDPYAPAQPYIKDVMGEAERLYNSGAGTQQWGGPVLSGLDPRTMEAMRSTEMTARNSNTGLPFQFGNNVIANNGISPGMRQPLSTMSSVASGRNSINTGGIYGGLIDRAGSQNTGANGILGKFAENNPINTGKRYGDVAGRSQDANSDVAGLLGGISSGPGITTGSDYRKVGQDAGGSTAADTYLTSMAQGGSNPHLQAMLDDNASRVSNRVNSSISGAGRTGSFAHGDALVRSIAAANNPLLAQAYDSDQNRRLSATGMIDSSRRAAEAGKLAAISGETGVQGQNISNKMSAGGLLGNLRNANFATELSALGGQTNVEGQNAATRIGAATGLGGSNRADVGVGLSGVQGLTGVQGQNISNKLGASQGILGAYGQGMDRAGQWAGMAPQNYAFQKAGAQDVGRIGEYMQGRSQTELDAERQAFEQGNMMPWQQLQRYSQGGLGAVAPYAANAGVNQSVTDTPSDPFRMIAGLGLAGASLFNPMSMMGSGANMAGGYYGGSPQTNPFLRPW